ncbi:ABC-2 type transport system ATP-binding protein [Glaciihabitans tibetensis]|uniref:ABC-2 type transport system ATP-binding protein n=1 Tax=Glaciihabitans tibetensis TaxID=1266600 RepID=A0A2T0VII6_9MICO|nr:ABC transporter ATP-binding protein [Glaciihabitans tibetensis]PRY70007.1 ABC-2 type transport system ATP-binding protein [Glaciihabitans tibetensis]
MTNAIEIRAVTRRFGRVKALDEVSFTVPVGSICGLLGRNGAGKTTVMSIISGQDRPTSGRVEVLGATPFEHAATLSKISYVRDNQRYPDDYRLHHVLRIAPEFAPNWSTDVASELVDGFQIPAKTPIKKFSRGQLSAVAIVLGLASRAPVTLFDEPYLGLDVSARALFYSVLLRDLATVPRTVLLSTHLIEESESLFDRVVIVDRGRVVVEEERDDARELALSLSGVADVVDRVAAGRAVLQSTRVGGLKSVIVRGPGDSDILNAAALHGVQVAPASLQDLVMAYGTHDEPATTTKEGVRA